MRDRPEAGLMQYQRGSGNGELANYYLTHSAARIFTAGLAGPLKPVLYEKALALTQQKPERQSLEERIRQLK
jgi:RNA polymerase sigma-70 factor (ECF subfamily)